MRTIISSTQRVTAGTWESAVFILVLLAFAIMSAWFVWEKGIADGKRKVHKLVVECLLIIASVVPPELPIQLNLAVNQSLLALTKLSITCTEPFRITFGGKLDVCCFVRNNRTPILFSCFMQSSICMQFWLRGLV